MVRLGALTEVHAGSTAVPRQRPSLAGHLLTRQRSLVMAFITSIVSFTFITVASAAEKPFAAPQVVEHPVATNAGSLAQVTLSLLLVLAAVFAAAWVVRRLRGFSKFGVNAIQIVADTALGSKERAVLVQVGNQQLLLGVTAGQVNLLHVLAEPVAVNSSQNTGDVSGTTQRADFQAILKRSLGLK